MMREPLERSLEFWSEFFFLPFWWCREMVGWSAGNVDRCTCPMLPTAPPALNCLNIFAHIDLNNRLPIKTFFFSGTELPLYLAEKTQGSSFRFRCYVLSAGISETCHLWLVVSLNLTLFCLHPSFDLTFTFYSEYKFLGRCWKVESMSWELV